MLIPWIYFIQEDEQLVIESLTRRRTLNGPGQYVAAPLQRVTRRKGIVLAPTEYLRVRNTLTGELRNVLGPTLFFPTATEEITEHLEAITLKENQYVRLIDERSGSIRVERGPASVYLAPTEEILDDVSEGINIDEHTAVLVRDTTTGNLELITEQQVFVPAPNQEIIEVRNRIRLEDHETVIIKDRAGRYVFRRGSDEQRSFFLDPYSELVTLRWSSGLHKDTKGLWITHLDLRPKFMWYEFEVRTQDNVELVLGLTFFWQITNVQSMIATTDDVPGDICSHARSVIIQSVSQVTLEKFLASFNAIIRNAVLQTHDPFYLERGVVIHAVEGRSITCKDPGTQRILQEIIQETTNRLNRIQKQESENEIRVKQIQGEIEAEEMRGHLLESRQEHMRAEALMEGGAEAQRVHSFLEGLGEGLAREEKIAIFNTLRKGEVLEALSAGSAQLYFTPSDVNLSIESRQNGKSHQR
ncbi:MAG: hypothetical protein H0T73_20920 [Ardenticatenales bacterium]|nr:hypothetical protein [Ardenticatenales bacterium]